MGIKLWKMKARSINGKLVLGQLGNASLNIDGEFFEDLPELKKVDSSTPGCVSYMFSSKGVLVLDKEEFGDEDKVMEDMLECGADDMIVNEDSFEIYTEPSAFADVHKAMSDKGYTFVSAEVEKIPSMETNPKPEDVNSLKKMISILEDNEDVQNVYTNCAIDPYEED